MGCRGAMTPPPRPVENEHPPLDITKIDDPKIRGFLADPNNTEDMAKGYLLLGLEAEAELMGSAVGGTGRCRL